MSILINRARAASVIWWKRALSTPVAAAIFKLWNLLDHRTWDNWDDQNWEDIG